MKNSYLEYQETNHKPPKFTPPTAQGFGNVRIKGDRKVINGKNHLSLAKLDIKIKVGDGKIKLENLFGGDRVLGEPDSRFFFLSYLEGIALPSRNKRYDAIPLSKFR